MNEWRMTMIVCLVAFSRRGWELLDEPQLSQPEKKVFMMAQPSRDAESGIMMTTQDP